MKRAGQLIAALAVLVTVTGQLQAAYMINTTNATYTPGDAWTPFGEPNTATYGQTFTVTSDNILTSFSLYLVGSVNQLHFRAYIYAWDGTKAVGPQLFQSAQQNFNGSSTPTEFAFSTGSLALTIGQQYVAFLNDSFIGQVTTAGMPYSAPFGSDAYSGGNFVFSNNGSNFSSLTTTAWDGRNAPGDVWFKASFTSSTPPTGAVPEPSSLALFGIGSCIAGLGAYRRRRVAQPETVA